MASHCNHELRELRRRERASIANYLRSIALDARFVAATAARYHAQTSYPLWANLRCGKWYSACWDGAAYFKSTDGHSRAWNFSATAEPALRCVGG